MMNKWLMRRWVRNSPSRVTIADISLSVREAAFHQEFRFACSDSLRSFRGRGMAVGNVHDLQRPKISVRCLGCGLNR